jgi:hypothetical protein
MFADHDVKPSRLRADPRPGRFVSRHECRFVPVVKLGRHGDVTSGSVACRSGPAAEAYVGAPFTVIRRYAEQTGGDWSAGYPGMNLQNWQPAAAHLKPTQPMAVG